jgi:MerR family copper efflux transcriptional regulator
MNRLTIGEVARQAGIGIETVRFYERRGLLPARKGNERGWHAYSAATVERLQFIRRARGLGFSTKEVKQLLALRAKRSATCAPFVKLLEARRIDLEIELREVTARLNDVSHLAAACDACGPLGECAAFGGFMSRT